jgi:curved DNA-binding protein
MDSKNYYKTLGVPRTADAETIKKAFRKLARQHHPDANKGDKKSEEKFKEINAAYEVLSDPEKRRQYDQYGPDFERRTSGGARREQPSDWAPFGGSRTDNGTTMNQEEFEELFGSFFTRGPGSRPRTDTPRDFEQAVEITLDEAFHGTTRLFSRPGAADVEVKIPRGARSGTKVRIKGLGGRNAKGQAGDLYLSVEVTPHPLWTLRGDDLQRDVTVDAFTAMLGGEAPVDTFDGRIIVRIPAASSSGRLIRLRGRGMPKLNSTECGDLYLRILVSVPTDLTDDERAQLIVMRNKRYSGNA